LVKVCVVFCPSLPIGTLNFEIVFVLSCRSCVLDRVVGMSSASGAWFWSLGFSDLYNVGLHIVAKCVSEVNTFLVGHQAALKEKAIMEDRLLQAEKALTLANEKLIELEGDVIALRQVVIDQAEQLSSFGRQTGVLGEKCVYFESNVIDLSLKQLRAGSNLAEIEPRLSLLERAAMENVPLRHQSADLADIDGSGSHCAEFGGNVTGKDASSPKETCPRQPLEDVSYVQGATASVCDEPLERSTISNKDMFRILSRLTPCTGCDPSVFLDWLAKIERVALAANCAEDVLKCWLVANLVESRLVHAYDALPPRSMKNWQKLKRSLIEKIVPPFYFERLRYELSMVKQRDDEPLDSYVNRFCGKAHIAYIDVKSRFVEAQLVWQFINGLSCENLRLKALEQRCSTLSEVAQYVLELKTLQQIAKSPTVKIYEQQNRPRSKPIPAYWFGRCFKCGVIGHCRRNCPRKQCSEGTSI